MDTVIKLCEGDVAVFESLTELADWYARLVVISHTLHDPKDLTSGGISFAQGPRVHAILLLPIMVRARQPLDPIFLGKYPGRHHGMDLALAGIFSFNRAQHRARVELAGLLGRN